MVHLDTVKVEVSLKGLSVGYEQYKPINMLYDLSNVLVPVELKKSDVIEVRGKGKNKKYIVTPKGAALIGEILMLGQKEINAEKLQNPAWTPPNYG